MDVRLKGQPTPIHLVEVERDDEVAVIGTTASGKRFIARRDRIGEPLPARHPFRVYLKNGTLLRVVNPAIEEVEKFFLNHIPDHGEEGYDDMQPDEIGLMDADGEDHFVSQRQILSVLSATPEDEQATVAAANGGAEPATA